MRAARAQGRQHPPGTHTAAPGACRPGRLPATIALALVIGTSAWPAQGAALRISGLRAGAPLQAQVQPQLDGQRMLLPLGAAGALRIQPWPAELPPRLGPQQLRGELRPLPAGPMARLEFTHVDENQPWLVLGSGTRPGQPLWDGWRLQLAQGRWWAQRAHERLALPTANEPPTRLRTHDALWCLYLLDARVPPSPHAAALLEQEPQADWALRRLQDDGQACETAPRVSNEPYQNP